MVTHANAGLRGAPGGPGNRGPAGRVEEIGPVAPEVTMKRSRRRSRAWLAVALLLAVVPAWAASAAVRQREVPPRDRWQDPFVWKRGNLAWLEPMIARGVAGEALGVDAGFFQEGLRARANMSPNHEAVWRALRYLAAVRGEAGDLERERGQIEAWFLRQRREGLQLDEPGGYVQPWAAASATAALAAWEDLEAHPDDPSARRVTRTVLGWWRDFGAYYGRLRAPNGLLLRVGARQIHRPRDAAFDEVLVDLLLGPAAGGQHPYARKKAGKPEREWLRRGLGAWSVRAAMERGVPLAEVARQGLEGPLPRIRNRVTIEPGRWAWMPQVDGRGPVRSASWIEDGEVRFTRGPAGAVSARRPSSDDVAAGLGEGGLETGPAAPLPPLPELPGLAPPCADGAPTLR